MQYAVLLYADGDLEAGPGAPEWEAALGRNRSFQTALSEHGLTFSGAPLHGAATATSVRVRDDRPLVTDGPFAETKEQLWGFYLVEAPDLDLVLELSAGLWEAEHGTVEVRPVIPTMAPT